MAGFPLRNEQVLQQWKYLFESRSNDRSTLAQKHWNNLVKLGLPDRYHENWKYTPLDGFLGHSFALPTEISLITREMVKKLAIPLDAVRLVFINGYFNSSLSDSNFDHFEIHIVKAAECRNLPEPIQPEIFLHLTESLSEQVSILRLTRNQVANRPLYLLNISSGCKDKALSTIHYRHHLQLEESAQAHIIEHYVSLNERPYFTGTRLTMKVDNNAKLMHTKLLFENAGSYHFSHNDIIAERDTKISSYNFLLSASLSRHNTSVWLNGENSELSLNSLTFPIKQEISDTRTFLVHQKGFCKSSQLHKTISRDHAHSVFNGLIKVEQHALKTDAKMKNNNLLLGLLAEVDSSPQLEIYADDVKCNHGATVGQIDKEQLFYLRTRGINENEARYMIVYAFAAELTETIDDKILKTWILQCIKQRFYGGVK